MDCDFRWNDWNVEHIAEHGIDPLEAEYVIRHARPPFPEARGDGKFQVAGQTAHGRHIQAIFIFSPADVIFVIHARPLTDNEKRRLRRRDR
jgi:uncharacterized DUF497 family protein